MNIEWRGAPGDSSRWRHLRWQRTTARALGERAGRIAEIVATDDPAGGKLGENRQRSWISAIGPGGLRLLCGSSRRANNRRAARKNAQGLDRETRVV